MIVLSSQLLFCTNRFSFELLLHLQYKNYVLSTVKHCFSSFHISMQKELLNATVHFLPFITNSLRALQRFDGVFSIKDFKIKPELHYNLYFIQGMRRENL